MLSSSVLFTRINQTIRLFGGLLFFTLLLGSCREPLDPPAQRASARVAANAPLVLGYFPSWSETWLLNGTSKLTSIPAHVNHVFFAFAKPNLRYTKGSFDLSQTGIQVPYDGQMLKSALSILSQKGTKVILSLGGETYWASADAYNINYQQIKDLVDDLGFAGIDWDFEPNGSFQDIGNAANVARFIQFITNSRQLMPKLAGYIIACAPAGCGALGGLNNDDPTGKYAYAKRNQITGETDTYLYAFTDALHTISIFGFSSTGHMIPVFKAAGSNLDIVAFQGYNIGATKDRTLMYNSYAWYANQYGFRVAAGTTVPNEPWGPYYTYTAQKTATLAEYIRTGGPETRAGTGDGIMIWQLLAPTAYSTDANYTGVTYLNVAAKVLNGVTPTAAIGAAFDYQTTTPPSSTTTTPPSSTTTTPPNTTTSSLGSGCGYAGYDATKSYPTPGMRVYYNGKIYENKWWANPGEAPNPADPWGVWKVIQDCTGGTTTPPGTTTTSPPSSTTTTPPSSTTVNPPTGTCGYAAYDVTKAYPTKGTRVYYSGKIFESKWYINPGEKPNAADVWGAWKVIQNCPL